MQTFRKLETSPLVSVLMEVRFSTVLSLANYIASIQDKVRADYPIFKKEAEQLVEIDNNGLKVEKTDKYIFSSKDKASAFHITPNRLIFITKKYGEFDSFKDRCIRLLEDVAGVMKIGLYERLGLRYSNCIRVSGDNENELKKLFSSDDVFFNPALDDLGLKAHRKSDSLIKTGEGFLVIRTHLSMTNATVFDDLSSQNHIELKRDESASLRMLLDLDHFWEDNEEQQDFDVDEIISRLGRLHDSSRSAFWKLTSEYARDNVWR